MSPEKALYELLCDLFAAHELHRFIQHHFKRLARDLPEGTSIANLAHAVAGLLQRHGHITLDLFEHLAAERPDQRPAISATAARWNIALALAPDPAPSAPPASPTAASATTTAALIDPSPVDADAIVDDCAVVNDGDRRGAPQGRGCGRVRASAHTCGPTARGMGPRRAWLMSLGHDGRSTITDNRMTFARAQASPLDLPTLTSDQNHIGERDLLALVRKLKA